MTKRGVTIKTYLFKETVREINVDNNETFFFSVEQVSEAVRKDFKVLPVVSLLAVLGYFHMKSFRVKCKCGVMFVDYFACLVPLFVHIYYSETPKFNLQTNKSSIQEADSCRTTGAALYICVVVYAMDWKVVDRLVCQICRTNAAVVLSAPTNRIGSFVHCSPRIALPFGTFL